MLAHWDRHGFGLWALHDRTDGRFVGRCGVAYLHDFPDAELAYTLARRYWGRGLATEAARAALAHALGALRLPRVVGVALVENLASQKVLLKAGMTLQGPYRYDGKDARLYGIDNPTPPP
jgi:RimJ/RimL family protein N-acetyltransferase